MRRCRLARRGLLALLKKRPESLTRRCGWRCDPVHNHERGD